MILERKGASEVSVSVPGLLKRQFPAHGRTMRAGPRCLPEFKTELGMQGGQSDQRLPSRVPKKREYPSEGQRERERERFAEGPWSLHPSTH